MRVSKRPFQARWAALLAAAAVVGCAGPPSIDTTSEPSFDGLYEVKNSAADQAWARPGLDLSGYTKVKLHSAGVQYRPGGEKGRTWTARSRGGPYEISEKQKERFEALVREVFRDELAKSKRFTITDEVGPDVLLIMGGLLDVVSWVPPEPIGGRAGIYLSSIGEATLVLEIRDSESNAVLARAVDRRAAEDLSGMQESNRVNNTSEIRRLIRRWGRSLREGLDSFGGSAG